MLTRIAVCCGTHAVAPPGKRLFSRGTETAYKIEDPAAAAWGHEITGVYYLGLGQFDQASERFEKAIDGYRRLGDWQHWGENVAAHAQAAYYCGDIPR